MRRKILHLAALMAACYMPASFAYTSKTTVNHVPKQYYNNAVMEKANQESLIPQNYIGISFYKPTYFLPFYYTGAPYNAAYVNQTPRDEQLKKAEVKYQISLKVPLWKNVYNNRSNLYFAYTLLSYWQAYNKRPFVRSNDYEPEFFLSNQLNRCIYKNWQLDFLNVGYEHQSNGFGDNQQRGWDRVYLDFVTSIQDVMIDFKPWYIIHANSKNSNVGDYLGYGRFLAAYKFYNNVVSFEWTNIGTAPKRITGNLTLSVPLTPYLKGYVEVFSGYGQSLIEYNHRTNSAGVGLALSDWL